MQWPFSRSRYRQVETETDGQADRMAKGKRQRNALDWNIDEYYGCVRKGGMTYSLGTVSLNQLLYPHPDTQVKLNTELRDGVETLWSNLDQRAEMKTGVIICSVGRTSASTLYAVVVRPSYTALCSIISSKSISLNTCIPKCKASKGALL